MNSRYTMWASGDCSCHDCGATIHTSCIDIHDKWHETQDIFQSIVERDYRWRKKE